MDDALLERLNHSGTQLVLIKCLYFRAFGIVYCPGLEPLNIYMDTTALMSSTDNSQWWQQHQPLSLVIRKMS